MDPLPLSQFKELYFQIDRSQTDILDSSRIGLGIIETNLP